MKRLLAALAVWLALGGAVFAWETKPTPVFSDGTPIQVALPATEHMRNVGGSDGAGLCVYTSVTLSGKWHNIPELANFRKFAEGRPGGSYPEKLAADIKTYATRQNVKLPSYVQHTGGDDTFLDLCMKTRHYPGITYAGKDDFYDGPIAHMVNLVHLDEKHGAIQDNNRAGKWTMDTRQQLLYRWKGLDTNGRPMVVRPYGPIGGGWAFVWLAPPAPPPTLKTQAFHESCSHERVGTWERVILADDSKAEWSLNASGAWDVIVWVYWVNGNAVGGFYNGKFYSVKIDRLTGNPNGIGDEIPAPLGVSPPENEPTEAWNKGIDVNHLSRTPRYWINDVEVSQVKAYAAVFDAGADGLVDDSDKYHLSLVGVDKESVLKKFATGGSLEKYARRLHIQVYTANDWPTKTILTSAVTLQEPAKVGGKVIAATNDTSETSLKLVLGSAFDPPPPKPEPLIQPVPPVPPTPDDKPAPPTPDPSPKPVTVWLILGGILVYLFKRK